MGPDVCLLPVIQNITQSPQVLKEKSHKLSNDPRDFLQSSRMHLIRPCQLENTHAPLNHLQLFFHYSLSSNILAAKYASHLTLLIKIEVKQVLNKSVFYIIYH